MTITIEQVTAGPQERPRLQEADSQEPQEARLHLLRRRSASSPSRRRGTQHAALLRQARRPEAEGRPSTAPRGRDRARAASPLPQRPSSRCRDERSRREERGLQKRQARQAAACGGGRRARRCMPGTRCSAPTPAADRVSMRGELGLLRPRAACRGRERGTLRARARRAPGLDRHRASRSEPGSSARSTTRAVAAWTTRCIRSASTMRCWRRSPCAAAFAVAMLVRSRVKPFQPTHPARRPDRVARRRSAGRRR